MSQEYSPVTWQDETTSQQGTLINAARLDQMQTAHHYADGWREVDAVPTADPGVDYHQVVYCTADSTFYRWNGSAWTKDIDDVTKAELDAEIERATLAEGALDSAKADKATTLAGYGITDAYTKAQTDTLLAGKMDDGDAYTKAETDTLLADKADVSALTDGSVTKVGTADVGGDLYPIKLVAGVPTAVANALVDTASAQDISNTKAATMSGSSSASNSKNVPARFTIKSTGFDRTANQGINRHYPIAGLVDKNDAPVVKLQVGTSDNTLTTYLQAIGKDEGQSTLMLATFDRGTDTWTPTMANAALDAYAPMVRTANAQTIAGVKTFTDTAEFSTANLSFILRGTAAHGTIPTANDYKEFGYRMAGNGTNHGLISFITEATTGNGNLRIRMRDYNGGNTADLNIYAGSDKYVTAPARTYNTANTSDVVTIGSLKASTDVVHTSGAETVAGAKTFTNTPKIQSTFPELDLVNTNLDRDATPSATQYALTFVRDKNANEVASYGLRKNTAGQQDIYFYQKLGSSRNATLNFRLTSTDAYITAPSRAYNASNTDDVATINTLDNYTPMVRTSGNQTIGGEKTFSSNIIRKTGLTPTPSSYLEASVVRATRTDDAGLGAIMAASGTESQIMAMRVNHKSNSNYYTKLFIRIRDNGRCDLIMESNTSQGYEQHIIYTFGTD